MEKFTIHWPTYTDHLREMLHDMMKSDELTDVTLICDDKIQLNAHKIVLSACSSVFKNILSSLPQNSSVIYFKGIQHQEMESILEFMYLGVATLHQERMNEFLNVAKNLEIKEINIDEKSGKSITLDETEITIDKNVIESDFDVEKEVILDKDLYSSDSVELQGIETESKTDTIVEEILDCDHCESQFVGMVNLKKRRLIINSKLKKTRRLFN